MLFNIEPLRMWVHKVLPVVYDDSLSYYEVLAKTVRKLNEVIDLTDEQTKFIQEFSDNLTKAINEWEEGLSTEWTNYKEKINTEWENYKSNTDADIELWEHLKEIEIERAVAEGIYAFAEYFEGLKNQAVGAAVRAGDEADRAEAAADEAAENAVEAVMPTLEGIFDNRYAFKSAIGSPLVAQTAAEMTDTNKIYVYVGDETGYVNGNWYYYDGTAWTSGGVYNSVAVVTDTTLTQSGVPADAKVAGNEITDLKSAFQRFVQGENLMGNEAGVLYPVYIAPGEKFTVSTSDGSAFAGNSLFRVQLVASDGVTQTDNFALYGDNTYRTITTSTSYPTTYYLRWSQTPRIPMMVVKGDAVATYVPYVSNQITVDKLGKEIEEHSELISTLYNGEIKTSEYIQGKYVDGVWESSTSRCTTDKLYNVESGTIVGVDGSFTGTKYAISYIYDDGTNYDSGWRNYNSSAVAQKNGKVFVNFAKSNGTDEITPSDITATVAICTPINDNHIDVLARMNFWHNPVMFSPNGAYKNSVSGIAFCYENGHFIMNGEATAYGAIRLTNLFDVGIGDAYIESFTDGIHLKPNKKYRVTSKLYNGARITSGQRYGVTVSVYDVGGSTNIGSFNVKEDTVTNDFIAPQTGVVNICIYINSGSKYADCRGFIVLEEAEESSALKEYYEAEADDTISKVRQINNEPALVFPCVTDIHRYKASVQTFSDMINNVKDIAKNVKCDFVVNTGDTIEGDQQQSSSLGEAYDCVSAFTSIGEPFFYVEGNHDNNPYISSGALVFNLKQVYSGFFTSTKNVIFNANENGTDYYFDFPIMGVRFISINSCNPTINVNYGFGTTTAAWLEQALNTGHTVILATHVSPIKEHVWNNINPQNADAVRSVLSNFVNGGGKLIIITGHSHIDAEFVNPYIEVTNVCQKFEKADITTAQYLAMSGMIDGLRNPDRTANTYTADAWTVCIYKPLSNELDMIRFGAGVDRYIHCTAVSSGTLTTRFNSATWSTSDSSVATVANGVVTVVGSGRCAIVAKDSTGNIEVWVVES